MRRFKAQFDKRPVSNENWPCDEILPGDGLDPRFDSKSNKRVPNRKALQLCSQVADSLNLAMGELADERLRESFIASVLPAPDSTQLLIIVQSTHNLDEVLNCLQAAQGFLRSQVASAIHRKRVPQLKFVVQPFSS